MIMDESSLKTSSLPRKTSTTYEAFTESWLRAGFFSLGESFGFLPELA